MKMRCEPIILTLEAKRQATKSSNRHCSETFAFVLEGEVCVEAAALTAAILQKKGESIYYQATKAHQIKNNFNGRSRLACLLATNSLFYKSGSERCEPNHYSF